MHGDEMYSYIDVLRIKMGDQRLTSPVHYSDAIDERRYPVKIGLRNFQSAYTEKRGVVHPTDLLSACDKFRSSLELRNTDARHDIGKVVSVSLAQDVIFP